MINNTKLKGNKAEAVVLAEFIKNDIPVSVPFGDNEKYDLVVEINGSFKSVQIKYGSISNGCVTCDIRHRIGVKRIDYETYLGKVDYIAVWCEENDTVYLLDIEKIGNKTQLTLRLEPPKNNSCITKVLWASEYKFNNIIK